MTLEGANRAMKSSRGGLSRDTELLERLQRIRAALEEVREELRDGVQDAIVDADAEGAAAVEAVRFGVPDADVGPDPVSGQEPVAKSVAGGAAAEADGAVSEGAADGGDASRAAADAMPRTADAAGAVTEPKPAVAGTVPPKGRMRRRRKGDDEDKELFPFYEQSLF